MRAQVNTDLGNPEMARTTARPTGSSAPTPTLQASRGMALAQSLRSLKPELDGYLKEIEGEFQQSEEARAYDTLQGMTYEEARQAVESGAMKATDSPYFRAAFQKQFGLAHAASRRRELVDAYHNSFDKYNGDVEQFLADFALADAEKYGDNKWIMSGLREGMQGVFAKIKDDNAEFRSGYLRQTASDQFYQVASGTFDRAIEAGEDPMPAIEELYGQHREMLGLTFEEMDEYVFQLAQEKAAAGDVEGVNTILGFTRMDEEGNPVGSFLDRPQFSLRAQQLRDQAEAEAGQSIRRQSTEAMVDLRERSNAGTLTDADRQQLETMRDAEAISTEMLESLLMTNERAQTANASNAYMANQEQLAISASADLLRRGQGWALQDVTVTDPYTGSNRTFTAADLIESAATEEINVLMAREVPLPQIAQRMAEWGVDYTYTPFENALSSGYLSLTEAVASAGDGGDVTIPEPASAAYSMWKGMANQPRLRDRHIKNEEAGNIFRDAEALEMLGLNPEEALMRSASIDRKSGRDSLSSSVDRNRFESAVNQAVSGGWFRNNAVNASQVSRWIERSVRVQMDLGIGMSDAVKNATERFKESHEVINGVAVNIRDNFIPPNFSETSRAVLEDFAEVTGEDMGDLTLYPSFEGSDHWIVVYRDSFLPVGADEHAGRYHISELQTIPGASPVTRESVNEGVIQRREDTLEDNNFEQPISP